MKLGEVARNPLGIIGLFISLIYGFANWMLGSTANTLVVHERIIIIWFIVLFPVLILIAFCYLVVYHHGKLYAPKDYNKDESFLQTLSPFDRFVRLSAESFDSGQVRSEERREELGNVPDPGEQSTERPTDAVSQDTSDASPPSPVLEVSPAEDPEPSADETAPVVTPEQPLEMSADVPQTVLSVVEASVAETDLDIIEHAKKQEQLARMKELFDLTQHFIRNDERFAGLDVMSDVKMGATGVVYDAAVYTDSGLQCLEVKYLRSSAGFKNLLIKYINQARLVKAAVLPAAFNLKLVILYDWNHVHESEFRRILAGVRPMLQDFIEVELVPRSSVRM